MRVNLVLGFYSLDLTLKNPIYSVPLRQRLFV